MVELGHADDDAVADADLLGLHGGGGEEELGRGAVGVFLEEVVLDGPDGVEADFVGDADLFEAAVVDLVLDVVLPGAGDGDFVEDAEAHAVTPTAGNAHGRSGRC